MKVPQTFWYRVQSSGQCWTGLNFCTSLVLVLGSKADLTLGMYGRYKPGVGTGIRRVYT